MCFPCCVCLLLGIFQTWKWATWCLCSLMLRGGAHVVPKSSRARRYFWVMGFLRWIAQNYSAQMDVSSESSFLFFVPVENHKSAITCLIVCLCPSGVWRLEWQSLSIKVLPLMVFLQMSSFSRYTSCFGVSYNIFSRYYLNITDPLPQVVGLLV